MNKTTLVKIFLRSFFIHTTLNFRRMQNIGFAMSIIPLIREWKLSQKDTDELLTKHLQRFNTNPYFSAPIIGTVVRLEEERLLCCNNADAATIKQSMMGPYAAIGDTFFWGALRPFAALVAIVFAYLGCIIAPVVFLLLYSPAHLWIRLKGFIESYRRGKQGVEFIRLMNLPRAAIRIRWFSLAITGLSAVWIFHAGYFPPLSGHQLAAKLIALAIILFCFFLIKKKISQFYIIYGVAIIILFISIGMEIFIH